jgi:putative ABC transport system substrate-binding protein
MNRRETLFAILALSAIPLAARAQQSTKLPTIGFLGSGSPSGTSHWVDAFSGRLRDLGWSEGRNVKIEYRWAEGRTERSAQIAAEFVRLKVDVIVTYGTAAVMVAKQATSVIPIVFATAGDPVGNAIVASLARPGGNVTGMSILETDTSAKRLELLRELVPSINRLAIIAHVGSAGAMREVRELETVGGTLGLQTSSIEIRQAEDIAPAVKALKGRWDALFVATDPLVFSNRTQISTLALGARLPTICNYQEYAEAGCLMSYGPNVPDMWRRAADVVNKVLRGTKPSEIPVEQPTKFDLVINLKTAKALRITVPQSIFVRADRVIE